MEKLKIFISGTDDIKQLANEVYKYLENLGYEPIWFKKRFNVKDKNAMAECLENVKNSDRFILILDKRYGLPYNKTGDSITETEFNLAHELGKPILIFIENYTWEHSSTYHKRKNANKSKIISNEDFVELKFKGQQGIYEFIGRIQHKKKCDEMDVRWITSFNYSDDIIEGIEEKWKLPYIKIKNLVSWDDSNFLDPLNESGYKPEFMRVGGIKQIDIEKGMVVKHPILDIMIESFEKDVQKPQDKIYILLGKMACGKSTLIRLLAYQLKGLFYYYKFKIGFDQSDKQLNILYDEITRLSLNSNDLHPPIFVLDDIHLCNNIEGLWVNIFHKLIDDDKFKGRILLVSREKSSIKPSSESTISSRDEIIYNILNDNIFSFNLITKLKFDLALIYLKDFISKFLYIQIKTDEKFIESILSNQNLVYQIFNYSNALNVIILREILETVEWKEDIVLLSPDFIKKVQLKILRQVKIKVSKKSRSERFNLRRTIIFLISLIARFEIPMPDPLLKIFINFDDINTLYVLEKLENDGIIKNIDKPVGLKTSGYDFNHPCEAINYFEAIYDNFYDDPGLFKIKDGKRTNLNDLIKFIENKIKIYFFEKKKEEIISNYFFNSGKWFEAQHKLLEALEDYNKALEIAEQLGDLSGKATHLNKIGNIYYMRGDYDKALKKCDEALKIDEQLGDLSGKANRLNTIATIHYTQGNYPEAMKRYQEALIIVEQLRNLASKSTLLNNIGNIYRAQGNFFMALKRYEEALHIAEKLGDVRRIPTYLNNIGVIYRVQGKYPEALKRYEEALHIDEQLGDLRGKAMRLNNIGMIYDARGDYDEALKQFEEALKIDEQLEDLSGKANRLNNIGGIYSKLGNYPEALKRYEEALHINEQLGDLRGKATCLNNIGLIYNARGDYDEALKQFEEALKIDEQLGDLIGKTTRLTNIGGIYYTQGNYPEALKRWEEALQILNVLGLSESPNAKIIKENIEYIKDS